MMRTLALPLLAAALALGGCVAGIASSAVGMAVRSAKGEPHSNQHLQSAAAQACTAQASQYGAVHIIDVQQSSVNKIIVWGTVDEGAARRSFECAFGTRVTGFKLRAIASTG